MRIDHLTYKAVYGRPWGCRYHSLLEKSREKLEENC